MLAEQRQAEIVRLLDRDGGARVSDLARRFKVTEETVRRDLNQMAEAGLIRRSHGGAVRVERGDEEIPHSQREVVHEDEKKLIAELAVTRVVEGDSLILDASTTALYMAKCLPDWPLHVVTPSLEIAMALVSRARIDVVLIGGGLSRNTMSAEGPNAEDMLRRYQVNKAFVSCRGVDITLGASDATDAQASLRRVMLGQADVAFLLADSSKFKVRSLSLICPVDQFDEILTDHMTPPKIIKALKARRVRVDLAGAPESPPRRKRQC